MTTFYLYGRFGEQIGALPLISAIRKGEINGEQTLTAQTTKRVEKLQRILYQDDLGRFREYIVSELDQQHVDGALTTTAICEESIVETTGDYIEDIRPEGPASLVLRRVLEGSRWEVGTVDVTGNQLVSCYHLSVREAINKVAKAFAGELSYTIEVSNGVVTARKVNLLRRVGTDSGKRYVYTKDLVGVTRHVEIDNICTAMYGYGKGLELLNEYGEETGGYSRKLTFGEINGGKDYVEDFEALRLWGRPANDGTKCHVFGKVEFDDCEDMTELMLRTKAALDDAKEPKITYEADVVNLRAAGMLTEGVSEGDTVLIIDKEFPEPLRLNGRVLAMEEDLLEPANTTITLGNIVNLLSDTIRDLTSDVGGLKDHSGIWDNAGSVSSSYIDDVREKLNEMFAAAGTYKYESWELGTIYSNVPLDENGKPTATPAWGMQLCSAGFRIASKLTPTGEFDWTTFGTGEGFTADVINAGVIRGGSNYWNLETGDLYFIKGSISDEGGNTWNMTTGDLTFQHGRLQSADGRNFWNLTTGEFSLQGQSLTVDGQTIDDYIKDNDSWSTEDQKGVFDRLTNGGTTQGIYLNDNKVYINATYIKAGTITDNRGYNYWNLATGEFSLSPGSTKVDGKSLDTYIQDKAGDSWDEATALDVFNKLTDNGTVQGLYMKNGRIYLNATYIQTGMLTVNDSSGRTLFNANVEGHIVKIGNFAVSDGKLVGENIRISSNMIEVYSSTEGFYIGMLGANYLLQDASRRFVALTASGDSRTQGVAFAIAESTTATEAPYRLLYSKNLYQTWNQGWNSFANWDFHSYLIRNAWIDVETGGGNYCYSGTVTMNFSETNRLVMTFKKGFLTSVSS